MTAMVRKHRPERVRQLWDEIHERFLEEPRTPSGKSLVDVSFLRFFGDRGKFMPVSLMEALIEQFGLLVHVAGTFYLYHDRGLWIEAQEELIGKESMKLLGPWARSSYIRDVLQLLKYQLDQPLEEFQPDPGFINLQNGTLNLQSGELLPHDPKYKSRCQLPYSFEPDAADDRWQRTLRQVFRKDPKQARTLQQWFGYCLTSETFLQAFMVLVGTGANGKGVVLSILEALVGGENVCAVPVDRMGNEYMVAQVKDKLVNLGGEVDTSKELVASTLKALTGEDTITANRKYKDPVTFRPTAKHVFAVNEMMRFSDATYAMRRRTLFLLFTETFAGKRRDPYLKQKLLKDLPGILNWALEGLADLMETKVIFKAPSALAYEARFAAAQNPVLSFVDEICAIGDRNARVERSRLYLAFERWHERNIGGRAPNRLAFYERFRSEYPTVKDVRIRGVDYFRGVKLRGSKKRGRQGGKGGSGA